MRENSPEERDDSKKDVYNDLDDHGLFGTGGLLQANNPNCSDGGTTKNTQNREELIKMSGVCLAPATSVANNAKETHDNTSSDWDAAAESAGTNGGLVVRRHCE
jgi:hypothetical protein